jgi:hypothetical protein
MLAKLYSFVTMSLSLCCSGIFRNLDWRLFTDVSGGPINVIFKNQ